MVHAANESVEYKQFHNDYKNQGYTEKKIKDAWACLEGGLTSKAYRYVTSAQMYFKRISDKGQEHVDNIALQTKLNALAKAVDKQKAADEKTRQYKRALTRQKAKYCASVHSNIGLLYMLQAGKKGNAPYSLSKLETFRNLLGWMDIDVTAFRQRFALLIKDQPAYAYSGMEVIDVLDLLEKRSVYRDALVVAVCQKALAGLLNDLTEAYSHLKLNGEIDSYWLDQLYGPCADQSFQRITPLLPYYEWVGKSAPQQTLNEIASFKPKLRSLLVKISSTKRIKVSDYPNNTVKMARVAAAKGQELGMQLMHIGMASEGQWGIQKSRAGIPMHRTGRGRAVFQKKQEPFLRSYDVSFLSDFNGNGFAPISEVVLSHKAGILSQIHN